MRKDDLVRMRHMFDAAQEALSFTKDRKRSDLDKNRMLSLSLVRLIEIIGEAASKISLECQNRYQAIPWGQIISMRNRLIHAYFDIDNDRLWDTVRADLPALIAELRKALPPESHMHTS